MKYILGIIIIFISLIWFLSLELIRGIRDYMPLETIKELGLYYILAFIIFLIGSLLIYFDKEKKE